MRTGYRLILLSFFIGIFVWVLNAILDTYVFKAGGFIDELYVGLSSMQITHRLITVVVFIAFGLFAEDSINKIRQTNSRLIEQGVLLDKQLRQLHCLFAISKLNEMPSFSIEGFFRELQQQIESALSLENEYEVGFTFEDVDYGMTEAEDGSKIEIFEIRIFGIISGELRIKTRAIENKSNKVFSDTEFIKSAIERITNLIERRRTRDELQQTRNSLRLLNAHLNETLEKERISIAREIHDELGQLLTAFKINLSIFSNQAKELEKYESGIELASEVEDMKSMIDITISRVRKLVTNLRPEILDNLGLIEALKWHTQETSKQTDIIMKFDTNVDEIHLEKEKTITLFRIYQESLTNIVRHSEASHAHAIFEANDNTIVLRVTDDGIGINENDIRKNNSFGLIGMKERAKICGGEFNIWKSNGKGSIAEVILPINESIE